MNGTDGFLDIHDSHLRVLDGNIHAKSIILDQLDITSSNTTSSTVQFLNGVTAFKTTANVEIGTANLFVDTSTSNVGILTSTPTHTLDVRGTANVEVLRTSSNIEMNGGTFSLGGHMIPSANEQYDIGSAEYKIRDMYVSDNSLWIGDKAKISFDTTEDKLTFRKRKVSDTFIPAKIIDLATVGGIGDNTTDITNDIIGKPYTPVNLGAMKLPHWLQYAKEFQPNIKLSDIFASTNSDYDSTSTAEGSFSGTGALTLPSGTTEQQPTGVTGMIRFNSTSNRLEVYNGTVWQSVGGVSATQSAGSGTTTTSGGYKIHAFTSTGTLNVINGGYMDVLIVAGGGGGGGGTNSGGGGAGGVLLAQDLSIGDGPYNITVGDGGAAPYANGTNGSSSSFDTYSANGGGGGGEYRSNGLTGGNGGGAGADDRNTNRYGGGVTTGSTPSGFTKYGYSGGGGINGTSSNRAGGGGGGAGGAGGQANGSTAGSGGAGIDLSAIFGTTLGESGYFASGGHGQSRQNASSIYAGPVGGGGGNVSSRAGLPNTGGGGHGGYMDDPTNTGVGGSGIVIIRYLL